MTRIRNPVLAGQELLKKGLRTKWVIVKMGAKGSTLITMSSISCAPAFKVLVGTNTFSCVKVSILVSFYLWLDAIMVHF